MHHKFIVRDRSATWTGSANFTPDGLHGADNDCVVMHSRAIAAAFLAAFDAPWRPPDSVRVALPDGEVAALFAPGSGMREEILGALEKATQPGGGEAVGRLDVGDKEIRCPKGGGPAGL
jgi:phosphatidylserine/phosphatidylglycerophosphate/cardiolipin synthase-like enzyme